MHFDTGFSGAGGRRHGACWASPLTTELYSELNCIPSPLQMISKPTLTSYLLTQGHINMYPHIQGPQNIPFYLKKKYVITLRAMLSNSS